MSSEMMQRRASVGVRIGHVTMGAGSPIVVQSMTDDPLTEHPETGQPVRRLFVPFGIGGKLGNPDKTLADDSKLEKLGFTKYVKSDDGKYDKVVGKGPDLIGG